MEDLKGSKTPKGATESQGPKKYEASQRSKSYGKPHKFNT